MISPSGKDPDKIIREIPHPGHGLESRAFGWPAGAPCGIAITGRLTEKGSIES